MSTDLRTEIERLAEEFESCRKVLLALGDENRQHLISCRFSKPALECV